MQGSLDDQGLDLPRVRLSSGAASADWRARLQPGMGWQGDMRVGAQLDIQAGERMDAEIVIERHDGDLHLAGSEGLQLLGLSEARLAVSVHDGVWLFTPRFKGRILGEVTGSARLRTAAQNRWPAADAPRTGRTVACTASGSGVVVPMWPSACRRRPYQVALAACTLWRPPGRGSSSRVWASSS